MVVEKKATLIIQLKDFASKGLTKVGTRLNRLSTWVGANKLAFLGLGVGIAFLAKKMIGAADKMEQWTISFETMLGSAGKARDLMEEIKVFAKETPFELPDVITGAKRLLAFGIELENIIPNLKMLGDVSAALGVPMERLILNFGQVKAQTKLTGRELRDFAIAGVPLLGELAKNLNMTEAQIVEMVSRGKIGFKEVEDAFKGMSGEGGRFNNLMARQMVTFTGVVSNLQDSLFQLSAELGETLLPTAKDVVGWMMKLVDSMKENITIFEKAIGWVILWATTIIEMFTFVGEFLGTFFAGLYEQFRGLQLIMEGEFVEGVNVMRNAAVIGFTTIKEDFKKMVKSIELSHKKLIKDGKKTKVIQEKDDIVHKKILLKQEILSAKELDKIYAESLKLAQKYLKQRRDDQLSTLNYISSLTQSKTKALQIVGKAAAISIATIDTWVAFGKALAAFPPPFSYVMAGAVAAAGMANVARISGVALAEGGIVLPRQGGIQATIGEGGVAEAIIPLEDEEAKEYIGEGVHYHFEIGTLIATEESLTELAEKVDEKLYGLERNGQRVSA